MSVSYAYVSLLNTMMNHSACLYIPMMTKNWPRSNMIFHTILWDKHVHPRLPPSDEVFYTSLSWFLKGHSHMLLHFPWIKAKGKAVRRAFYSGTKLHPTIAVGADTSFCFLHTEISSEIALWPFIKDEQLSRTITLKVNFYFNYTQATAVVKAFAPLKSP